MSDTIIKVDDLSKRYFVGHQSKRDPYSALRDVIAREAANFFRKTIDIVRGRQVVQGDEIEEFWALKDVSFEVKQGEVVGIIGRNGAGKSTLLKILSRITEPTTGRVELKGRVASLLEVGTGFHPELTGRENIYLNGAILGMKQSEIRKKFDEIITFAEVERFLDTPVKRSSSGLYVRLAFAVAAHLEPEILLVDEVLAVGDASFQEKCLGKIKHVAAGGRTVLFVSHNMSAVLQLTQRAILLSQGRVEFVGAPSEVVEQYIQGGRIRDATTFDVRTAKRDYEGTDAVRILSLRFDRAIPRFGFLEPIHYIIRIRASRTVDRIRAGMTVFARDGSPLGNGFSREIHGMVAGEERELALTLASIGLAPGSYFCGVSVGAGSHRTSNVDYDVVLNTLFFEVLPEMTTSGTMAEWHQTWGSISFPELAIEPIPTRS